MKTKLLGFLQHLFYEIRAEAVLTLAIDVEVRSTLNANLDTQLEVLVDTSLHGRVEYHVLLELFDIEANFLSDSEIDGIGKFAAMRSECVAVFPELALLLSCDRRSSCGLGVGVEAQREVL